jgi:hypothetical protein
MNVPVDVMLGKALRVAVGVLALTVVAAAIYLLTASEPAPVAPADSIFSLIDGGGSADTLITASDGFVDRPLFTAGRRPSVSDESASAVATSTSEARSLSGINLLGVFGSGDQQGVIFARDNGERARILVGQRLDEGWLLQSVGPDGAEFVADGVIQTVSLHVISDMSGAVTPVDSAADGSAADQPALENVIEGPLTFDSMYKARAARQKKENEETSSE